MSRVSQKLLELEKLNKDKKLSIFVEHNLLGFSPLHKFPVQKLINYSEFVFNFLFSHIIEFYKKKYNQHTL